MDTFDNISDDHAIVDFLQRMLLKTVHSDTKPSEVIINEHVPPSRSQVGQERIHLWVNRLQVEENKLRVRINSFQHVEGPAVSFLSDDPPPPEAKKNDESAATKAKPPAKKRRKSAP